MFHDKNYLNPVDATIIAQISPGELQGIYQSLQFAKKLVSEGEKKSEVIISKMAKMMNQVPFIKIDYIAITDNNKLEPVRDIDQEVLVSLAVFLGSVRLIDNIVILP